MSAPTWGNTHPMAPHTDIALLPLTRDLDATNADDLRSEVDRLINGGCRRIVLNMARVTYIDSLGMAALVASLRQMRAAGGVMSLTNVCPRVYRSLQLLRLVDLMPISKAGPRPEIPALDPSTQPLWKTTFPVNPSGLADARRHVLRLVKRMPFSPDETFDIELAAGEALGNAIDHTSAEGVVATVAAYPDRVEVDVEDCGPGFELGANEEPPRTGEGSERGRGIKLMRLLADSVSISERPQGLGTVVRIVKLVSRG